jgi:hypothetical protein
MKKTLLPSILILFVVNSCQYFRTTPIPELPIEFEGIKLTSHVQEINYQVSHKPGIYTEAFDLSFTADSNVTIYYTLNGKTPKPNKKYTYKYTHPIQITEAGVIQNKFYTIPTSQPGDMQYFSWHKPDSCRLGYSIKVTAYQNNSPISETAIYSYFVQLNSHHSFPIIALTADPDKLWSKEKGILVPGIDADTSKSVWKGNYFMDWKVPCFVEYFSIQGQRLFADQFALKIHGLKSPLAPQKSLRLYAKKKYGLDYFPVPFFLNDTITKQKRIVLRTLYSAWGSCLNADAIISRIAQNFDVDCANSTPVTVYINGEYWGIENLRERIDKHYLAQHYHLNADSIDIVLDNENPKAGSSKDYKEVCRYIESHDLSIDSVYNFVIDQFDKYSLMDYFILQTYFNNIDWPLNNHVLWKSQKPNSKWRYLLYDLDATFAHVETKSISNTIVDYQSHKINRGTLVFGNLIKNQKFKSEFISRYRKTMETLLKEEVVLNVIDEFEQKYAYDLLEHISRWQYPTNFDFWMEKNEVMRDFILKRKQYILEQLEELDNTDFI